MATCEIYMKGREELDVDDEAAIIALGAEVAGTERAGFKVQTERASAELAFRRLGLKPLSEQELNIWRRWFPTAYRQTYHHCGCGQAAVINDGLTNYRFDRVPTSVLELIQRCRDEFRLDWLEIRTPEQNLRQDPGLFGGKGPLTILGARWGESDDRLLDFREIQTGLRVQNERDVLKAIATAPLATFGFATFLAGLIALTEGLGAWVRAPLSAWYVGAAVCVIPWSAYWYWKASRIRKIFAFAFS